MNRIELYIDNNNSLSLKLSGNKRTIKGKLLYNCIDILSNTPIKNITILDEDLVIKYPGNDFVFIIKKYKDILPLQSLGNLNSNIRKYFEKTSLGKIKNKKVKRKNKYTNKVIAVSFIFAIIIGAGFHANYNKNVTNTNKSSAYTMSIDNIDDSSSNIEFDVEDVKSEKSNEISSEEIKETETTQDKTDIIIEHEDLSNELRKQNTEAKYGSILKKYSDIYGLDYNLMVAIATQERGEHSIQMDKGGATGLMQIQNSAFVGKNLTAYNFESNSNETVSITEDNIKDLDFNIKLGCMILQNALRYMDYNILAGLQCYNMGNGNMNKVLKPYSYSTDKSVDEILADQKDIGWLDYRNNSKAGDPIYIENVLRWMNPKSIIEIKKKDGSIVKLSIGNEEIEKKQTIFH